MYKQNSTISNPKLCIDIVDPVRNQQSIQEMQYRQQNSLTNQYAGPFMNKSLILNLSCRLRPNINPQHTFCNVNSKNSSPAKLVLSLPA